MELTLTDDQELLRDTATRFMEASCTLQTVRRLIDEGSTSDLPPDYLRGAAELGWFSLLVPEEFGGGSISGEGLADAAIVAEERGRRLQPGPFVGMNVVASALASEGSAERHAAVLQAIMGGEGVAAWATSDATGAWAPGVSISASPRDGGFVLSGSAGVVQGAGEAQWLLVVASGPEGLSQFLVETSSPGVGLLPLDTHDVTQRFAAVELADVDVGSDALVGEHGRAGAAVERQFQIALVLAAAETVGALDAMFEMTRQYAIDRIAFGRPIGSFQAVKHQLADMSLSIEAALAITATATKAVRARVDAGEVASMAKAWLGDVGIEVAQGCFQVFAGIGYTWEHDLHLFLRRITMNGLLFGQSEWHRERICTIHEL